MSSDNTAKPVTQAQPADAVVVRLAGDEDAEVLLGLVHAAFAARPPVDPPAEALGDTLADIQAALAEGEAVLAEVDGEPAACLLVSDPQPDAAGRQVSWLRRVSVLPQYRQLGLSAQIIWAGVQVATELGASHLELVSRREFPKTLAMWQSHGFASDREVETGHVLRRELPARFEVPDAAAMQSLGRSVASLLRAGDLVVAAGPLGAGKTTFTQGLAEGLAVDGAVISPTFVISRVHPSRVGGPDLVHVDAYRLGSAAEVDDLDLDASMAAAVTLVEWGEGLVEGLSDSRLMVSIRRWEAAPDEPGPEGALPEGHDPRVVLVWGEGPRWTHAGLRQALAWPHPNPAGVGPDDANDPAEVGPDDAEKQEQQ